MFKTIIAAAALLTMAGAAQAQTTSQTQCRGGVCRSMIDSEESTTYTTCAFGGGSSSCASNTVQKVPPYSISDKYVAPKAQAGR
jgi:predicted lipoprotein with Yx(FWY)xxD motif